MLWVYMQNLMENDDILVPNGDDSCAIYADYEWFGVQNQHISNANHELAEV